jgi:hypothetical protein
MNSDKNGSLNLMAKFIDNKQKKKGKDRKGIEVHTLLGECMLVHFSPSLLGECMLMCFSSPLFGECMLMHFSSSLLGECWLLLVFFSSSLLGECCLFLVCFSSSLFGECLLVPFFLLEEHFLSFIVSRCRNTSGLE